ncbi:transposable element Tcb1 transposase [Trichonephila clavipes]|nr:transposable element Tcb1 transposase [Trichonephila clavipes]
MSSSHIAVVTQHTERNVYVLPWHSSSLDLFPIELEGDIIGRQLQRHTQPELKPVTITDQVQPALNSLPQIGIRYLEIGSRVGRNQTTVIRICHRLMQEGTTDQRGRSHPPQCTTSCEERKIVRMAVTDRSVTSRTIAHHIESVTHHSVSARTIRRRLQQSGLSTRRPLLGLTLMQSHRRLRRQWCDERRMWTSEWNEVVFTDELHICLQHHDGRI